MNKSELRLHHKKIRNSISADEQMIKSEQIQNHLIYMPIISNAQNIFVYLSHGREVLTDKFILEYINKKNIYVPECDIENEIMFPVKLNRSSQFKNNIYGISEVIDSQMYTGDIDVIIVPGIAFDKYGNRIGHGKGYYDKYLNCKNVFKIGLCYSDNFITEEISCDKYDIKMDFVITENGVVSV